MNHILQEDIALLTKKLDLSTIKNKTFFITGATGLIGHSLVEALLYCNQHHHAGLTIIALVLNKEKALEILPNHPSLKLLEGDINNPLTYSSSIDYIIHGASITNSKSFITNPVETILTTVNGTKHVLELAKEKNVTSMVYLSTMEIYGEKTKPTVTETDYGYIDLLNVRSSYPMSKRLAETLCISYASEYNVPVKIARLAQTFGAGSSYNDSRVFAYFARSIIEGTNIILKTDGSTSFNMLYLRDALHALMVILLKGDDGVAYNAASSELLSIADTAKLLVEENGNKIEVIFEQDDAKEFPPAVQMSLDTTKLQALGWQAEVGIKEAYQRLIDSFSL